MLRPRVGQRSRFVGILVFCGGMSHLPRFLVDTGLGQLFLHVVRKQPPGAKRDE